ncbi:MAG: DUF1573 domain-containing protein [Paludibacteraceae bacterium]|nr:DUF1573 domain-containing protein [Paludibacteraceae bacterium]
MKKLLLFFLAAAAFVVTTSAAGKGASEKAAETAGVAGVSGKAPEISFDTLVHNFGTFPEETGKVSCTFTFKNTGGADLVLQKVKASCGCTTPEWTKTPVAPGETGTVIATYNASGRPGAFTKTITVTSNAGDKRLTIKGEVIPKAAKIEDQYQIDFNGLRLKKKHVYMNAVEYENGKTERVQIVNNTKEDMVVSFKNVPAYMEIKSSPEKLKAGEKGTIDVTIKKNAGEWGSISEDVEVLVNGKPVVKDGKNSVISIHGNIQENFASLTAEEKANAPVVKVGNVIKLGEIKADTKKTFKFTVSNDGKSDLYIRKASADSKAINLTAPSKPIKPGKKADIKLEINTKGFAAGDFTNRVTLITNDPNNKGISVLQINGVIKK